MKTICIIIITSFVISVMWKCFHRCPLSESEKVTILEKAVLDRDSLLYFWFNDYGWRLRVLSGIEKDTAITRYQKWNQKQKKWVKEK